MRRNDQRSCSRGSKAQKRIQNKFQICIEVFERERAKYDDWKAYIEDKLKQEGFYTWMPTTREVENLSVLSEMLAIHELGFIIPSITQVDYREAVLTFYRALNRKNKVDNKTYLQTTQQLVPPQVVIDGKTIPLFGIHYVLPTRQGSFYFLRDIEEADESDDIIKVVREGWTPSEQNFLFGTSECDDSVDEVEAQVDKETLKRLGTDYIYDPIYFRLDRERILWQVDSQRRIAFNYMANDGLENVDEAIEKVEAQMELLDKEIEELEIRSSLFPEDAEFIPSLLAERTYNSYLRNAFISQRRFLERAIQRRI